MTIGAQRLPASRRAGPAEPALLRGAARVLNAFRHHGERDRTAPPRCLHARAVLNAFRHHGERDDRSPSGWRSASFRCSTPSGITASGTSAGDLIFPLSSGAQRLPASRRAGRGLLEYLPCPPGAQRLPASRRAGPATPATGRARIGVLNAFRHHGERDMRADMGYQAASTCSTPSGITASGTTTTPVLLPGRVHVLNAFRHHGERDSFSRWARSDSTGAQRLPASRRAGPYEPEREHLVTLEVLNAFRHHGERD